MFDVEAFSYSCGGPGSGRRKKNTGEEASLERDKNQKEKEGRDNNRRTESAESRSKRSE